MQKKPHKRVSEMVRDMQAEEEEPQPRIYWRHVLGIGVAIVVVYILLVAALVFAHGG